MITPHYSKENTDQYCAIPAQISYGRAWPVIPLLVLCLFSLQSFAQEPAGKRKETIPEGLHKAWIDFAQAVIGGDEKTLRASSTSCIYCVNCLENTPAEDSAQTRFKEKHPRSWYRLMYAKQCYIPVDKFISDDLPLIFDATTKKRLTDSIKVLFHDDSENKHLYEKSCILRKGERDNAECYEVLVQTTDLSIFSEGLQKAFAFVRIGNRYIFCGYSTIP